MFKITEGDFRNQKYGTEGYLANWPMLYILENGKQAYIGESNQVITRMAEHQGSLDKKIFEKVHFIYSAQFNQSVTFDYEAKLIRYIAADGLFKVTNKNSGIADKEYFGKKEYDEKFHVLWRKLQDRKLVKHSLEEIENSDLFKYSPYKELTDDQRFAVEEILETVKNPGKQCVVVDGMPGSGKTIVAIYIIKYLKESEEFRDKTIAMVIPQPTLRKTLKRIFKSLYGLRPADVIKPSDVTRRKYDILLVDEAHKLRRYKNISYRGSFKKACERIGMTTESDELDWILNQCECPVLFYDKRQVVGPSGMDVVRFEHKIKSESRKRKIHNYTLKTQMRVKGGNDYISYLENILAGKETERKNFPDYEFYMIEDFSLFDRLLHKKEKEFTLTRMAAGYAWDWISKKDKSKYDIEIEGIKKQWNHCTEGWLHSKEAINEVGCIHSTQGYDLNYTFVIIGNEFGYDLTAEQFVIRPECYYDKYDKNTASEEELLDYIRNIYYVLMTRGIHGTYLYVCDEGLRQYMKRYVLVWEEEDHE